MALGTCKDWDESRCDGGASWRGWWVLRWRVDDGYRFRSEPLASRHVLPRLPAPGGLRRAWTMREGAVAQSRVREQEWEGRRRGAAGESEYIGRCVCTRSTGRPPGGVC